MKTVELLDKKAYAPEKFSELTESQLYLLARAFTYGYKVYEAKVLLASHVLKNVWMYNEKLLSETLSFFIYTKSTEDWFETDSKVNNFRNNRVHLANCFDWIGDEHITDKWLIPRLTIRRWFVFKTFKGPQFRFSNIAFWQWCQAEFYFFKYTKTNNRDFFNKFCACLFMPAIGEWASTYDDALVDKNAKWFANLTPIQVTAIRLNYLAIKGWLALNHPNLFQRSENADLNAIETIDMAELLLRAAKAQHMDEEAVAKKPLLVELKKLEINAKDFKDAKKNMEDMK